jgi:UDP-glucose 4-epimerase
VLDLAATIAALCHPAGQRPAPRHLPPRSGEIRHSVGAPEKARAMLGLGAATGLDDGLAEVIGWIRAGRPGLSPG